MSEQSKETLAEWETQDRTAYSHSAALKSSKKRSKDNDYTKAIETLSRLRKNIHYTQRRTFDAMVLNDIEK